MTNKTRNSSVMLLSTIMLTSVFAFTNMPQASADTITINFDAGVGEPSSYTESGLTVTSLDAHLHFFGDGKLSNHVGCCSTPYEFEMGGAEFTVVSVDAFDLSGSNQFISSSGEDEELSAGTNTFVSGFAGITSFKWSSPNQGSIDNLVITITTTTPSEVFDELQNIIDDNPGTPLADKVEDAQASVQTVINELNKTPPDNQAAAGNIEGAIGDIEAAINEGLDPVVGAELMDALAGIASQLALDAIDEAIANSGDEDKISEAEASLAEGDALRDSGSYKDAVNKYKDALSQAEGA